MPGIVLNLMGPPTVALPHGSPPQAVRASKCIALLTFLALEPGPHSREELATLLWGDSPDDAARTSLRQALKVLRESLGDALKTDRQYVSLAGEIESDVRDFLRACADRPADAAAFDVTRFMADFSVSHAPAFEEWLERTRASLRHRHAQVLRAVAREALAGSRWREAAGAAARWLDYEPLSDEAARVAVEAAWMAGDRAGALARLASHRDHLARELHLSPSPALQALMRRIERVSDEHRVAGESGDAAPDFRAPLVGRGPQWRTLREAWQAVTRGSGRVVLLEGEVGVGKTRLADEFLRWVGAERATVVRGRSYDPRAGVPYGPIAEVLRDACDAPGLAGTAPEWLTEVTRLIPELRRRFPGLPEPPAPTDVAERWRLFEAVTQVLLALAAERPTVVFIDDLQWCDGETCALLHFVARRIEAAPVALLATVRLGDAERDAPAARLCRALRAGAHSVVVPMAPLSADEVWGLVRELGRIGAPDGARRFAARLHEVTDGNPFHVIELLKTLFTQGLLAVNPETGEWTASHARENGAPDVFPMPPTVRDAIAERVAQLPYRHRDLLATTAVAGAGCRTALLSHAHGISRLQAAALCDSLVERLLLHEDGGIYRCAHPVIADVVREGLTASRRKEVHRAIALALRAITADAELREVAGEIARHAERGEERAMTYTFALMASEEAVRRYAFDEALSWLDLAAGAAQEGAETEAVNQRTSDILGLAGWTEPPRRARRPGTPAKGIAQIDLDLG